MNFNVSIRAFCTTKEEIATDARIYTNVFVPIRAFVALLYLKNIRGYISSLKQIYNPSLALISSIRLIGFSAAFLSVSSMVSSGDSYSMHRYSFSSVFSFI